MWNTPKSAEAITLLKLAEIIERKGRMIDFGIIEISIDNRDVDRKIISNIKKSNHLVQDRGVEILQLRRLLKKIKFEVQFKLIPGYSKRRIELNQKLDQWLITEYDIKAKNATEDAYKKNTNTNIKITGYFSFKVNN